MFNDLPIELDLPDCHHIATRLAHRHHFEEARERLLWRAQIALRSLQRHLHRADTSTDSDNLPSLDRDILLLSALNVHRFFHTVMVLDSAMDRLDKVWDETMSFADDCCAYKAQQLAPAD